MIKLISLSKTFHQIPVLDNISLHVKPKEIFGLLGSSGAGKTTLIKILTGQLSYQGTAWVMNTKCSDIKRKHYKSMGMVLDNFGLYERLSCYDNLLLFSNIFQTDKNIIMQELERVGLSKEQNKKVGLLSKGMKQRLMLARAILHQPDLLFLDEPTSGLDPANADEIRKLLKKLQAEGMTIFLTTHNMQEAYNLCDNILLMQKGKLLEYGSPKDICKKHNEKEMIKILTKDGTPAKFPNSPQYAQEIARYFHENNVQEIHSSEPSLESVFLKLIGQKNRNQEGTKQK